MFENKEKKTKGRKAGVKTVPNNETKSEKFIRLGSARVNKALKAIKQIKNLSTSAYEKTPDQANEIIKALTIAVNDVNDSFIVTIKTEEPTFKL